MPSLEDDDGLYVLLPTSAKYAEERLTLPDPHQRHPNHETFICKDVWFEYCGDGGVYILIDETVLIFYVDGPGDVVKGRFKRLRWVEMWVKIFKAEHITYPQLRS